MAVEISTCCLVSRLDLTLGDFGGGDPLFDVYVRTGVLGPGMRRRDQAIATMWTLLFRGGVTQQEGRRIKAQKAKGEKGMNYRALAAYRDPDGGEAR
jgi:hypothetical protein